MKRIWLACFFGLALGSNFLSGAQSSLVSHGDVWHYRLGTPANGAPPSSWKTAADASLDTTWLTGRGGFGYADNTPEVADCQTLLFGMKNAYTAVYLREQFALTNAVSANQRLYLRMDFDDGFIAWLDGVYLTNRNVSGAPAEPAFNTSASGDHESSLGQIQRTVHQ